MMELIATGSQPRQRWRTGLQPGTEYELGRDVECDLPVPWDAHISRRHAKLQVTGEAIELQLLPSAQNPLFVRGERTETARVSLGEHFVIGSTTFQLFSKSEKIDSPVHDPIREVTFDRQELRKLRYQDAEKRIDALSHLSEVIYGSRTEVELHHRLSNLILTGISHAEAVAIVEWNRTGGVRQIYWDRRRETAGAFRSSSRLVTAALSRKQSVLHVWESCGGDAIEYTQMAESDWAFCTPVVESSGRVWGLYVAGRLEENAPNGSRDAPQLHADVKFTELVAEIISSVQRVKTLEQQRTGFRQFFPPPVLELLGEDFDAEVLEPRECDVTVIFCDLRGFSRKTEEAAGNLLGMLDRVSRALGVMTRAILEHGGVTGDFLGDAALGFWGWPFGAAEASLNACRAALAIRKAFDETRRKKDDPLADFELGIGIAHGRAVAGKIDTGERMHVTVFGPVVNLASRLESMTKQLRVPIVLDESTASTVRSQLDATEGRVRTLAKVLPYKMEKPVLVSELLPSEEVQPELTNSHLEQYEQGVAHFIAGAWEEAYRCLHAMPASDRAGDFLMPMIAQHNRIAPPDWDGVVPITIK